MASFQAIKQTAIPYWDVESGCYLAATPLAPSITGMGDSANEAKANFTSAFVDNFDLIKSTVNHGKSGRPAKNGVNIHAQVSSATKDLIDEMSNTLGLSQGEIFDCAVFALSKQVRREKPKLLIVSPPRKIVPIASYKANPEPGVVFTFRSNSESCASKFDGQMRWEPEQPWHYQWFDEAGQPTDFIGKLKSIKTVTAKPFLFEVTLMIEAIPSFAQKIEPGAIRAAQRLFEYIENDEKSEDEMQTLPAKKIECICNSNKLDIGNWGCSKCLACSPAYGLINAADFKLRYGRDTKFSQHYSDFELTWDAIIGDNWQIWIKSAEHAGALSAAPCDLMLKALSHLDQFCSAAIYSMT